MRIYTNREFSQSDVIELYEYYLYQDSESFELQLFNIYNSTQLDQYTVNITNASDSRIIHTTNGSVFWPYNETIDIEIYNISANASNQTYFNQTYEDVDTTAGHLNATTWQYQVDLTVKDKISGETITDYTTYAPLNSYSGGDVYLNANSTGINYTINVSSPGYVNSSFNVIEATYGMTEARTVFLEPYVNISIFNEKTGDPFNTSLPDAVSISIYCENKTKGYDFNDAEHWIYVPVDCAWDFMKLDVDYNSSSYYRTLIPEYTERDIDFFMLNLFDDLAVQIILTINDLTREYEDGIAALRVPVDEVQQDIIEQQFDVEKKVILYLVKDGLYTLSIYDNEGNERNLGYFVADAAEDKKITIPDITFVPDAGLGDKINWEWEQTSSVLRLLYNDTTASGTDSITFTVYNASNSSTAEIYSTTSTDVGFATFSYTTAANTSYIACFTADHATEGTIGPNCHTFSPETISSAEGWTDDEWQTITNWAVFFVVIFVVILAHRFPTAGLFLATLILSVATKTGIFDVGNTGQEIGLISIFGIMTVFSYMLTGGKG